MKGKILMKISKKAIIVLSAVGLIATSAGVIHAAAASNGGNNRMSALVTAIAQKFNLNTSDVQAVVDQTQAAQKAQMQAQQQQKSTDSINAAVTAGKLTQDQANLILAKEQEVKTFMASLSGKTPADRQTAMTTEMTSLKQWATDNNIPQQYISFGLAGFGGRGGFGMMGNKSGTTGTVAVVNGNSITLTGKNGTTYTIDASNASIKKIAASSSANTPPASSNISVSDIKVGDNLMVQGGTTSGTTVTATSITDGTFHMMRGGFHKTPPSNQ